MSHLPSHASTLTINPNDVNLSMPTFTSPLLHKMLATPGLSSYWETSALGSPSMVLARLEVQRQEGSKGRLSDLNLGVFEGTQ